MDSSERDLYFDVLQELGNIGSSNAVTSLTKMLGNDRAQLHLPKVNILDFNEVAKVVGSPEKSVFGTFVNITGDIKGMIMFIINAESARTLIRYLIGSEMKPHADTDLEFSEMDLSALEEMGNILSTSYLNALAMLTGMTIKPSVPFLSQDMAGAILSVPAIEFGKVADKVLFIESAFGAKGSDSEKDDFISSYFILVPDFESYKKILSSFGVKSHD